MGYSIQVQLLNFDHCRSVTDKIYACKHQPVSKESTRMNDMLEDTEDTNEAKDKKEVNTDHLVADDLTKSSLRR